MASASEQVAEQLRKKIVQGQWAPGKRLPERNVLAKELGACLATLQGAVAQMVEEGFVLVGPRKKGTYVAENPPHLSRYRLVFPFGPDDWGQFWRALESAARHRTTREQEFLCFYGLSGHRDIAEYRNVVEEVQTRRVAGLIFASSAEELQGTPLLEYPGLPRAAIAMEGQLLGIPKVCVDHEQLLNRSIDFLLQQGRRRIAILCASRAGLVHQKFQEAMAQRGLSTASRWEQFASLRNPIAARHVMDLMFQRGQPERPDGLIIADDNLVTQATEGLVNTGIRIPSELTVVASTNFPVILPAAVPVTRIGFDIPALLNLLVLRLQQIGRGETPPENTLVPAVFEPECTAVP
jgi:DNA-binding LacI/PurR family transcriptional regulator